MYVAILAGGIGTRLWPRSRVAQPKQFADIQGKGRTMIQETVDRLDGLASPEQVYIITGEPYIELAREQLPAVPQAQILAEPCGRNTAPALALACLHLRRRDPEAVMVALPSDHIIADPAAFRRAIAQAVTLATDEDAIVTLGIEPTFAHTGYGYIHRNDAQPYREGAFAVHRFLEKPDLATATEFLRQGGYYWNAGMFICRVQRMLSEIERRLPDLHQGLCEIERAQENSPESADQTIAQVWPHMPNISIDHGIMEQAERVAVIPLSAGWNDVGSWDALESILDSDAHANVVAGGDLVSLDSTANIVYAEQGKIVALVGVENLVVVDTGDAILVGPKDQMQRVKEIVDRLKTTELRKQYL